MTKPSSAIAPWWHTAIVLLPIAAGSIASAVQHGLPHPDVPGLSVRTSAYLTVFVLEWLVVFLVWLALRRRGLSLADLISGRWPSVGSFSKDLALAVVFMVVVIGGLSAAARLVGGMPANTLAPVTPRTVPQLLAWLALSATGGFCEEVVFRGYLTRQFEAWTHSVLAGVILQGIAFGLAHGYYYRFLVVVMVEGWLLGWLATWRKSLRPGILAHGLQDSLGGVAAFLVR